MMARWRVVEQQQIFNIITYWLTHLLTKVLLGTRTVSINIFINEYRHWCKQNISSGKWNIL